MTITPGPLTQLANEIHEDNKSKGFWDHERPLTETTMLIVTELSEAIESDRAGEDPQWFRDAMADDKAELDFMAFDEGGLAFHTDDTGHPDLTTAWAMKPEGVDVELIDALIRLLDLLGSRGVDVDEVVRIKRAYNDTRAPKHGKSY